MKAITLKNLTSGQELEIINLVLPEPGPGQVQVRILASAFNPIDYQMRKGFPERSLLKSGILGREFSGVVTKIGKDCSRFEVGDKVYGYVGSLASNGTYAYGINVPELLLAKIPSNLSFLEAAAVPMVSLTAIQCFDRMQLGKEESIFIAGAAGGVGSVLLKLLIKNGYTNIVTSAGNQTSKNHILSLGLSEDRVISYHEADFVSVCKGVNEGKPFDCVVDIVGGKMSEMASDLIKVNGKFMDIAALTTVKARANLFDIGAVVINISNYAYALSGKPADYKYYGEKMIVFSELLVKKEVTPPAITVVGDFSIRTIDEAHLMLEQNKTAGMKLVMDHGINFNPV